MAEFRWIVLGNKRLQQEYIIFLKKAWWTINNPAYIYLSNCYGVDKDYVKFFNGLEEAQRLNYINLNSTPMVIPFWRVSMINIENPLIKFSDKQATSLYYSAKFKIFCDSFPFPQGVEEISFSGIFRLFKDYQQKTIIFESKLIQI